MIIQKLKKAQALTEMAIFGTLILLSLHYLLTYLQRMNEQQYVVQEAFRQALKNAHDNDGFASYTVFSNKRTASIYNPSGGDRSLVSGSASILWGEDGESSVSLYKFNKDEKDLTEYFDTGDAEEGTDAASSGNDDPVLQVDDNIPEDDDEDSLETAININSGTERSMSTKVVQNSGNIVSSQTSNVNDWIEFVIINEEDDSEIYSIKQGLGSDGQYSIADLDADIENVMTGGSPRVWTVPK